MKPILKYPGGKEKELRVIKRALPKKIEKYYEPFLGGGAVFFGLEWNKEIYLNDKSQDLMTFYSCIKNKNIVFLETLKNINTLWKYITDFVQFNIETLKFYYNSSHNNKKWEFQNFIINSKLIDIVCDLVNSKEKKEIIQVFSDCIFDKFSRTKKIENERGKLNNISDICDNIECGFKRAIYTILRTLYNECNEFNGFSSALFFFLREFCYSSMFRYNSNGDFNVPYGGISYNHKYLDEKITYITSKIMMNKLSNAFLSCSDFYKFMKISPPQMNDFIFLDPPYDTEFSCYAKNDFTPKDQERLANYLLHECYGNWMLVIKRTNFIESLYPLHKKTMNGGYICFFDFSKKYQVSFKNRNDKDSRHFVITNYEVSSWINKNENQLKKLSI